jgi:hypothetical protein
MKKTTEQKHIAQLHTQKSNKSMQLAATGETARKHTQTHALNRTAQRNAHQPQTTARYTCPFSL